MQDAIQADETEAQDTVFVEEEDFDDLNGEPGSEDSTDQSESPEEPDSQFNDDFLKKYKGKSEQELLKILHDNESFIGKQAQEIGKLRQNAGNRKSKIDLSTELQTKQAEMKELEAHINELDVITDPEEYRDIMSKLRLKQQEALSLEAKQYVAQQLMAEKNIQIANQIKQQYENDYHMPFEEGDWEQILDIANTVSKDGVLSEEDIEIGIMKTKGREAYRKVLTLQGEMNARAKTGQAGKKRTSFQTGGRGGASAEVDPSKLSQEAQAKYFANLKGDALDKYLEKQGLKIK